MSRFAEEVLFDGEESDQSTEHHEWCLRMWRRIDRNQSNSITREELDCEEFRSVVKAVLAPKTGVCMGGPRYARAQVNMDQAVAFCLRKADLNSDGSLSFDEFKAFMNVLRQPHLARFTANMIFALFDLNGDSRIDAAEFREVYRFYLGRRPTEEQFMEEWTRLDQRNSGHVTLEEYIQWLKTSPNPIFHQHAMPEDPEQEDLAYSRGLGATASSFGTKDIASTTVGSSSSPWKATGDLMAATATSSAGFSKTAGSGWRPWHSCSKLCWEQRLQPPRGGPAGARLSTEQAKYLAGRKDRPDCKGSSPAAMKSLVTHCLQPSDTMARRPMWNPYLAGANANWINESSDDGGRPRQHPTRRKYFSRPQSLPQLQRHYETRPGFHDHRERMKKPDLKRKPTALSTDRLDYAPEDLCPNRGRPACTVGCMRDPATGERKRWNDFWQKPPQLKDLYQASTMDYRSLGPPPRHLYVDTYDDED